MAHRVFAETLATKFRELRSCPDEDGSQVAGGPTLSTTLKSLSIPIGAEWVSVTPRNFAGGAGTMRLALAPRLTIIATTDSLVDLAGTDHGKEGNDGLPIEPTALADFPIQDISDEMQDGDQENFAVDSFDTLANGNIIYVGAPVPYGGVKVDIGTDVNATASVLTVSYFAGSAIWTDISDTDGTISGGATMAVDGNVTWTVPTGWVKSTLFDTGDTTLLQPWGKRRLYWTRWEVATQLDADVDIRQMRALSRSTNYAELLEGQALEFSVDPLEVATLEVLVDAGTGNIIANAANLASIGAASGKLKQLRP